MTDDREPREDDEVHAPPLSRRDAFADVRADMLRGCDFSTVGRCRVCGGRTTPIYGEPPECECECDMERSQRASTRFFRDEDDDA